MRSAKNSKTLRQRTKETPCATCYGKRTITVLGKRQYISAPCPTCVGEAIRNIQTLVDRVVAFQHSKFPGQTLQGKLNHVVKEAGELRDCDGNDPFEWADLLILLIGAADMKGMTIGDLVNTAHAKMDINDQREWHPADATGCFHHKE